MTADFYFQMQKGVIVGSECVNRFVLDSKAKSSSGLYSHNFNSYSVHDGVVFITARDRLITDAEFARSGLQEGYKFVTLDDVLAAQP